MAPGLPGSCAKYMARMVQAFACAVLLLSPAAARHGTDASIRVIIVLTLPVVSDAGAGGQVLMDSVSFAAVKDRLEELGQVCGCAVPCRGMLCCAVLC